MTILNLLESISHFNTPMFNNTRNSSPANMNMVNSTYVSIASLVIAASLLITILVFVVITKSTLDGIRREVHDIDSKSHINLSVVPQSQPNYDTHAWGNTTCDDGKSCTTDLLVTVEGNLTCAHYNAPNNESCSNVCMVPQTGVCLNGDCNGLCKGFCPSPIDFSEEICPNVLYKPAVVDANLNGSLNGKLCFYSECLYVVEWPYISDWTCPPNVNMIFYDDDKNCMDLLDDSFEEKKCMEAQSLCLDTYDYGVKKVCLYRYVCSSMNVESIPPPPPPAPVPLLALPNDEASLVSDHKVKEDVVAAVEKNVKHSNLNAKGTERQAGDHKAHPRNKPNKKPQPKGRDKHTPETPVVSQHAKTGRINSNQVREDYIKRLRKIGHGKHGVQKRGVTQLGSSNDALNVNQFVISMLGGDSLYEFIRVNLISAISQRLESVPEAPSPARK